MALIMSEIVREFHAKHGFPLDRNLAEERGSIDTDNQLLELFEAVIGLSRITLENALEDQKVGDERLYRAHLMLEELGESIKALATKDELRLADGLGDLFYVVLGTADTYNIPLFNVVAEIHRSNMTKAQRNLEDPRMRDKGSEYKAPNIQWAIDNGREWRRWNESIQQEVGS
jgi:NTP pyrophosphatase (non-canonical NTP hydrolase)